MYYNFCKVHTTLRVTPAMEAGIMDHVWTLEELIIFSAGTDRFRINHSERHNSKGCCFIAALERLSTKMCKNCEKPVDFRPF
jgi:hypothetical protein